MGLARIFGLCFALLFASSVTAANIIDLGPSDYRSWGTGTNTHTPSGLRSSTGQTVRMPPLNTTLNVNRNAVVPYGSIANGMRNFARVTPGSVAASAAITGLFLAVDWVFDQASGEWKKESYDYPPVDEEFLFWASSGGAQNKFSNPDDMCEFFYRSDNLYSNNAYVNLGYTVTLTSSDVARCGYRYQHVVYGDISENRFNDGYRWGTGCPAEYSYDSSVGSCTRSVVIDLDPSDWQRLESSLPSASPDQVGQAGNDIQRLIGNPLPGYQDQAMTGPSSVTGSEITSTSTDPVTGDTVVTTTNTTTNMSYGDTTITTTNTTTSTTYQNGQETGTTVTTETPGELPVSTGGGAAGDWPRFCDWATVVCDWLNWTQEDPPPEQDLPALVDDDFYTERDISFGSKSCPEPYQVNLAPFMDTQVSVSFQPLCDFAGLIYYMVMAASYIIAAYISVGVARA